MLSLPHGQPGAGIHYSFGGARAAAAATFLLATIAMPAVSQACACGCGVFDVGTGAMFPDGAGGQVYAEVDLMDQNRNWSGTSAAPAAANADQRIRTAFYTVGTQYMFNRSWGVSVDVPYWSRKFTTTDADSGQTVSFDHAAIGRAHQHSPPGSRHPARTTPDQRATAT